MISPYIITLNVNGLNSPVERQRVAGWIKNTRPNNVLPKETHFSPEDTQRLKVKGWKRIVHVNGNQKKASSHTYVRQNTL